MSKNESNLASTSEIKRLKNDLWKVHIDIRFEVGEHGDGDPFDGSGKHFAQNHYF
jgi:hypothetical protein